MQDIIALHHEQITRQHKWYLCLLLVVLYNIKIVTHGDIELRPLITKA